MHTLENTNISADQLRAIANKIMKSEEGGKRNSCAAKYNSSHVTTEEEFSQLIYCQVSADIGSSEESCIDMGTYFLLLSEAVEQGDL